MWIEAQETQGAKIYDSTAFKRIYVEKSYYENKDGSNMYEVEATCKYKNSCYILGLYKSKEIALQVYEILKLHLINDANKYFHMPSVDFDGTEIIDIKTKKGK